ncbi:TonB-dependent receptor [Fulvitalea axinellae]|uniref:TonB-dependent receptor n=1 Tax=Fulvitalea axinellae TaxID=1182444 RepID=A0AAU9CZ84_9BACT|nr:TonB-dependent receptor [Fulvitalea axinellae]
MIRISLISGWLFFLCFACGLDLFAMTEPEGPVAKVRLIGKVVDSENDTPLEFATVAILEPDGSVAGGGVTDANGKFSVEIRPGKFTVRIEFISYQKKEIPNLVIAKGTRQHDLGVVRLSADIKALEAVEVKASRARMEVALDKKILNVASDPTFKGVSASEILDNIPSVSVDLDGNVSLRGSGNVRILVDGKPSGLTGISSTDALKTLPSEMIERVEVVTNPSARYEAEGTAGIINIVLKKNKKKGVNGTFSVNGGFPGSVGAGVNLNFRREKLNWFVNYAARYGKNPGSGVTEQFNADNELISRQYRDHERGGWSNSVRFGADYFINETNTLTAALLYRYEDNDNESSIKYRDYGPSGDLVGQSDRSETENETEPNLEYSLRYKKTFEGEGHEFVADFQYRDTKEKEASDFIQVFSGEGAREPLNQRAGNEEGESGMLLTADYVYPFSKYGKFESGYRGSVRRIENDYQVQSLVNDNWENNVELTNTMIYDETIHGVYAMVGEKFWDRLSLQGGLRMEYTDVVTELKQTDDKTPRDYVDFFPSSHITFEFAEEQSVQFSYSRRILRPRFWDLNPFFTFSDSRMIFGGNPKLDPEYTDSYELGYIRNWDDVSLSASGYYRRTTDIIQRLTRLTEEDGEVISRTRPENFGTEDAFGGEFTFAVTPVKWWDFDLDANAYYFILEGMDRDVPVKREGFTWRFRGTSKIKIAGLFDWQTRFGFRAPQKSAQGKRKAVYAVDLGFSRDILNDNGTLTLNVRDLFNSRKWRWEATDNENGIRTEREFQWRSRTVTLDFSYRLNTKKGRGGRGGGQSGGSGGGGGMF